MVDNIIKLLPRDSRQFLEFSEGRWVSHIEHGPTNLSSEEGGVVVLCAFGTARGLLACDDLPKEWAACLQCVLEERVIERCREHWREPNRDVLQGLRELLGTDALQLDQSGDCTLDFGPEEARFFGANKVGWTPATDGEPDISRLWSWLQREVKLQVPALEGSEYSSLLGVFGHHVGTLFKTSGAMTVWAQPDDGRDPTRRVLDKLLPIWGVSQAISLHKKQGEKGWRELLKDWVDPRWAGREDLAEEVQRSILSLALYVYAHGVDEPPFLPWVVHLPDGRQARWVWATAETVASGVPDELIEKANATERTPEKVEVESQTHRLTSLPPLADNPILFEKTLALTIGLFEMLSNLRKYPEPRGAGREDRKDLAELPDLERQVNLRVTEVNGSTTLAIEQPVVTLHDGGIPISRSVERIRGLERSLLKGIIETGQAEIVGETSVEYVVKMRQTWTYHWGKLLEEWKCHVN